MKETELILGYPVTTKSIEECISDIVGWIESNERGKYFVCANPYSLEAAIKDPYFDVALKSADMIVPDGIGIVIASKILRGNIKQRVTGSDIFFGLSNVLDIKKGYTYLFLGSSNETLGRIVNKMTIDFPNIKIAGVYSPPFKEDFSEKDNSLMVEAVNRVKPHVLWVGMTAPKQEKWIYKNKNLLDVNFIGAIGAVFDFYAGNIQRPSPLFQKTGLEWLKRFLGEPRRLWKRNLISNPRFILRVLNHKLKTVR